MAALSLRRPSISHLSLLRPIRLNSSLSSRLSPDLKSRHRDLLYDYLSPQPSYLLSLSLSDFLSHPSPPPSSTSCQALPTSLPSAAYPRRMPVGHHLVYFPTPAPSSLLLPDGTDPFQSPGEPFVRRMWAGGRIRFPHEGGPLLDATRAVCVEGIRDVTLKGKEGEEKVFVGIERRVALVDHEGEEEQEIRARVWLADEEDQGDAVVIERRNLVFLRERTPEELHAEQVARGKSGSDRVVKPPQNPAFTHAIVPTPQLLFRYSALTFNAHSIHLDKEYCRTIEGHRNLLVHGPLSLTFMLTVLRHHLLRHNRVIREIDYRNLAPLYAEEEMRVCGREKGGGSGEWDVWIEGRDGGVAVKGSVRTGEVEEREAVDLMEQLVYEGFDAALGSVIRH